MTREIDKDSPTWRAVKAWADERLRQHRNTADTPGMPMTDTENARGAIRDLRLLLALPEQKPITPPE